jgi:hypothetical protein
MVRQSLFALALVTVASPLGAQEEWTSRRPDGHAPFGVTAGRILDAGEMEVTYRFAQLSSKGVWFGGDSLGLAQTLVNYPIAPLELTSQAHNVAFAYGASERLSVFANLQFVSRERQQIARTASTATATTVRELGDMELSALYAFIQEGLYVAHAQFGVLVPTGASDPGTGNLPYDVRPGSGSFGFTPGLTVQTQNERGSVGAQLKGRVYVGENSSGYRLGSRAEGSGWIALRLNEYFSFSARVQYESWSRIRGAGDPDLVAIQTQDPGNLGSNQAGHRTDLLLGLNFYIPDGAHLGGNRLAIELLSPANRTYNGDQLGLVSGVIVGWQMVF